MADAAAQVAEGVEIVESCRAAGAAVRLIGGAAIALHSGRGDAPHRAFSDLDLIAARRSTKTLTQVLEAHGFEGERQFNALNGDRRLVFHGPAGKLDVFVDRFEMCHEIPLVERIELDTPTITVTDLLLTKLQVVELNEKDAQDVALLLTAHECGSTEGDVVNVDYLGRLLGNDWGLWRTFTNSLETVAATAPAVRPRADRILEAVEAAPRTRRFRLRARIGERKRWYDIPEEVGG
ncbi:nucleotidyltransferase family protein [Conexibacter sp. CPCC 206217]|nr:nucleotidyltransferase family protein [Conexibacter sp. CPCC 206217]MDO8210186.1 nucleotidyltransferase family protein [Conexibacter sp. CPCC 206217]